MPTDTSISPLLKSLSNMVTSWGEELTFPIDIQTGEHRLDFYAPSLSSHQRLAFQGIIQEVLEWIQNIPLVGSLKLPGQFYINVDRAGQTPGFRFHICGYDVTKTGGAKHAGVSKSVDSFAARMRIVAQEGSTQGDTHSWIVEAREHDRSTVVARNPRQAALIFSALHVRDGYEKEHWQDTVKKIQGISLVCASSEWSAPS
jgi:hypothetical protein